MDYETVIPIISKPSKEGTSTDLRKGINTANLELELTEGEGK